MQDAIRRLRFQARSAARGKASTAVRYSAEFRVEALEVARQLQSQGVAVARIARDLGVRPKTLALWLHRKEHARMRPVIVAPPPATDAEPTRPVVVTAHGLRIEGLDFDAVVRILRSLA
jgi:transposase-like protein